MAKYLTVGGGTKVVLLRPRLTAFPTPFNPVTEERRKAVDEQRALAADVGMHIAVLFCVCSSSGRVRSRIVSIPTARIAWMKVVNVVLIVSQRRL